MKIIRKVFALLLSVTLLLTPNTVLAVETDTTGPDQDIVNSGECGLYGDNVIWQLDSSGTLTFSGEGDMADYSWTNFVPNTPWYQHRSSIKKIVIGNGIASIGDSAFYKLNYVTSIQMSDDVVALGAYSFASCSNITEIQLPNNLQQIANYCFEDCNKLTSIVIPNSVSKLGDCSFTGCSKLQSVKLPSNISILPRGVFSECESLETIEIPNSVTEFVSYCFRDCTGLKSIVFPSGLKTIGYRVFSGCTGLEQLIIPNTVTSIGAEAFYDCTGLKRLELPNAITEIPSSLCCGCTNLENIEIPSTVTKIGSSAFRKCTKLSSVALRNGLKEIESSAFYMCINLKCLFVPDSIISIGKNAFGYYKNSFDQPAIIPEARVLCFANTEGEKYAQESNLLYSVIEIDINSADCEYTGMEVVPNVVITIDNVTLKKDTDFTVVYENNIDIGTAIARVNFINDYSHITGTVIKDFRIGKLLSKSEIKLDKDDYQYKMYLPEVTITSDDLTLEINKDYEVYYSLAGETWKKPSANTTKALWALGSCSVKIVGINEYIGEKIITVTVNKFNLQNAKVVVNDNPFDLQNFEYDGTEKKQSNVIVRDSNHNTISNAFYEISYKNNINVGTATMIITGNGEYYTGTLEKNFQIYPAQFGWSKDCYGWFYIDGIPLTDKWIYSNNKWYYLGSDSYMVSDQWMKDSKGWVYLGSDGAMLTNAWCTDSQGWCYVGADGYAVTNCWKKDSVGWIWLNANGSMTKSAWVKDGGKWYYLDANGYMVSNQWKKDSKGWVYLGSNGAMLTNAWCTDSHGWCYVGADGYAVTNCWKKDSVGWIWLNANGSMTKSAWVEDGGKWYYLDANGYMIYSVSRYIGGKTYHFNSSGVCTNP